MKAKDKAEELIEKYQIFSINHKKLAIQCALICVDEILKASPSAPILSDKGSFVNDIEESTEWWKQVKQEILNRQ